MASLVCKYCGSYLNDTDEICPECGAVNEHFKRFTDKTPETIEELRQWYVAHKLPPEETTRFFIGKNIKEPRAFGIYEDNGRFVVYKNKNDGSRAVRYEGRDEAYAVNELYLRLKEEILNQKKHNAKKLSQKTKGSSFVSRQAKNYGPQAKNYTMQDYPQPRSYRAPKRVTKSFGLCVLCLCFLISLLMGLFGALDKDLTTITDSVVSPEFFDEHYHYYYVGSDSKAYFLDAYHAEQKEFSWWTFDDEKQSWVYYKNYSAADSKDLIGPEFVDVAKSYGNAFDFMSVYDSDWMSKEFGIYDITTNHDFIDANHHYDPVNNSYYCYNNKVYYFLDDYYSEYGSGIDDSGWYVYEDDSWQYYCDADDKEAIGEDLWYSDWKYYAGDEYLDIYSYVDQYSTEWNATDFSDTDWYTEYQDDYAAYEDYINSPSYNSGSDYDYDYDYDYDDDYDWDWDSGSDWDSGGSDWDSDW